MIRRMTRSLALAGSLLELPTQAALPDNVLLQREAIRSLTMMLQIQGEGMYARQRQALQDSIGQLHLAGEATAHSYPRAIISTLGSHDAGQQLSTEQMDELYRKLLEMIETLHQPDADAPYLSVLMTEYLTLRYAFASYIGLPTATEPGHHYYQTDISELLNRLDEQLTQMLARAEDNSLSARWTMLHHALSDMHEGWTRTRSGNSFAPIVVILNGRALSDQLGTLLSAASPSP